MSEPTAAIKTEDWRLKSPEDLLALQEQILSERDPDRPEIVVCHGTGCLANGNAKAPKQSKPIWPMRASRL